MLFSFLSISGNFGNSSGESPTRLKIDLSHFISTQKLFFELKDISLSGSSFIISNNFLAERVILPSSKTSALYLDFKPTSKSVAVTILLEL